MTFKKKMLILGCLAVVAAAGVGTSVAYILNDATEVSGTLSADSGIIISWGEDSTLESIETLTPGTPQYQSVVINWEKSKSVSTGIITTTFTLTTISTDLSIAIADADFSLQSTTALATLDSNTTSYEATISLDGLETTTATYYLQYSYTGASGENASGSLNVAVTYGE